MASLEIDHVIFAVRDLDTAAARFLATYGLVAVAGGRHIGHGTGNRLIPLGGAYLELMAVVDVEEARGSALGRRVLEWTALGDRPAAVCLRTDDIEEVCSERGLVVAPMQRVNDDGVMLRWRLAGLDEALGPDALPFFIEWDVEPGLHPAEINVNHPCGAAAIDRVMLGGEETRMAGWLGQPGLGLDVDPGPPGVRAVFLAAGGSTIRVD